MAGIHATKLEDMERRLRNDMAQEAAAWGGRVMLHAEMPPTASSSPQAPNGHHAAAHAGPAAAMSTAASGPVMDRSPFSVDGAAGQQNGDASGGAAAAPPGAHSGVGLGQRVCCRNKARAF